MILYWQKSSWADIFRTTLVFNELDTEFPVSDSNFMTKIAARIKHIKGTINSACNRAGRDPNEVKLVVVTKSVTIEAVKEVINLGITELGENRVQQLKKISSEVADFLQGPDAGSATPKVINWHMIGHLQRNKVRQVADHMPIDYFWRCRE